MPLKEEDIAALETWQGQVKWDRSGTLRREFNSFLQDSIAGDSELKADVFEGFLKSLDPRERDAMLPVVRIAINAIPEGVSNEASTFMQMVAYFNDKIMPSISHGSVQSFETELGEAAGSSPKKRSSIAGMLSSIASIGSYLSPTREKTAGKSPSVPQRRSSSPSEQLIEIAELKQKEGPSNAELAVLRYLERPVSEEQRTADETKFSQKIYKYNEETGEIDASENVWDAVTFLQGEATQNGCRFYGNQAVKFQEFIRDISEDITVSDEADMGRLFTQTKEFVDHEIESILKGSGSVREANLNVLGNMLIFIYGDELLVPLEPARDRVSTAEVFGDGYEPLLHIPAHARGGSRSGTPPATSPVNSDYTQEDRSLNVTPAAVPQEVRGDVLFGNNADVFFADRVLPGLRSSSAPFTDRDFVGIHQQLDDMLPVPDFLYGDTFTGMAYDADGVSPQLVLGRGNLPLPRTNYNTNVFHGPVQTPISKAYKFIMDSSDERLDTFKRQLEQNYHNDHKAVHSLSEQGYALAIQMADSPAFPHILVVIGHARDIQQAKAFFDFPSNRGNPLEFPDSGVRQEGSGGEEARMDVGYYTADSTSSPGDNPMLRAKSPKRLATKINYGTEAEDVFKGTASPVRQAYDYIQRSENTRLADFKQKLSGVVYDDNPVRSLAGDASNLAQEVFSTDPTTAAHLLVLVGHADNFKQAGTYLIQARGDLHEQFASQFSRSSLYSPVSTQPSPAMGFKFHVWGSPAANGPVSMMSPVRRNAYSSTIMGGSSAGLSPQGDNGFYSKIFLTPEALAKFGIKITPGSPYYQQPYVPFSALEGVQLFPEELDNFSRPPDTASVRKALEDGPAMKSVSDVSEEYIFGLERGNFYTLQAQDSLKRLQNILTNGGVSTEGFNDEKARIAEEFANRVLHDYIQGDERTERELSFNLEVAAHATVVSCAARGQKKNLELATLELTPRAHVHFIEERVLADREQFSVPTKHSFLQLYNALKSTDSPDSILLANQFVESVLRDTLYTDKSEVQDECLDIAAHGVVISQALQGNNITLEQAAQQVEDIARDVAIQEVANRKPAAAAPSPSEKALQDAVSALDAIDQSKLPTISKVAIAVLGEMRNGNLSDAIALAELSAEMKGKKKEQRGVSDLKKSLESLYDAPKDQQVIAVAQKLFSTAIKVPRQTRDQGGRVDDNVINAALAARVLEEKLSGREPTPALRDEISVQAERNVTLARYNKLNEKLEPKLAKQSELGDAIHQALAGGNAQIDRYATLLAMRDVLRERPDARKPLDRLVAEKKQLALANLAPPPPPPLAPVRDETARSIDRISPDGLSLLSRQLIVALKNMDAQRRNGAVADNTDITDNCFPQASASQKKYQNILGSITTTGQPVTKAQQVAAMAYLLSDTVLAETIKPEDKKINHDNLTVPIHAVTAAFHLVGKNVDTAMGLVWDKAEQELTTARYYTFYKNLKIQALGCVGLGDDYAERYRSEYGLVSVGAVDEAKLQEYTKLRVMRNIAREANNPRREERRSTQDIYNQELRAARLIANLDVPPPPAPDLASEGIVALPMMPNADSAAAAILLAAMNQARIDGRIPEGSDIFAPAFGGLPADYSEAIKNGLQDKYREKLDDAHNPTKDQQVAIMAEVLADTVLETTIGAHDVRPDRDNVAIVLQATRVARSLRAQDTAAVERAVSAQAEQLLTTKRVRALFDSLFEEGQQAIHAGLDAAANQYLHEHGLLGANNRIDQTKVRDYATLTAMAVVHREGDNHTGGDRRPLVEIVNEETAKAQALAKLKEGEHRMPVLDQQDEIRPIINDFGPLDQSSSNAVLLLQKLEGLRTGRERLDPPLVGVDYNIGNWIEDAARKAKQGLSVERQEDIQVLADSLKGKNYLPYQATEYSSAACGFAADALTERLLARNVTHDTLLVSEENINAARAAATIGDRFFSEGTTLSDGAMGREDNLRDTVGGIDDRANTKVNTIRVLYVVDNYNQDREAMGRIDPRANFNILAQTLFDGDVLGGNRGLLTDDNPPRIDQAKFEKYVVLRTAASLMAERPGARQAINEVEEYERSEAVTQLQAPHGRLLQAADTIDALVDQYNNSHPDNVIDAKERNFRALKEREFEDDLGDIDGAKLLKNTNPPAIDRALFDRYVVLAVAGAIQQAGHVADPVEEMQVAAITEAREAATDAIQVLIEERHTREQAWEGMMWHVPADAAAGTPSRNGIASDLVNVGFEPKESTLVARMVGKLAVVFQQDVPPNPEECSDKATQMANRINQFYDENRADLDDMTAGQKLLQLAEAAFIDPDTGQPDKRISPEVKEQAQKEALCYYIVATSGVEEAKVDALAAGLSNASSYMQISEIVDSPEGLAALQRQMFKDSKRLTAGDKVTATSFGKNALRVASHAMDPDAATVIDSASVSDLDAPMSNRNPVLVLEDTELLKLKPTVDNNKLDPDGAYQKKIKDDEERYTREKARHAKAKGPSGMPTKVGIGLMVLGIIVTALSGGAAAPIVIGLMIAAGGAASIYNERSKKIEFKNKEGDLEVAKKDIDARKAAIVQEEQKIELSQKIERSAGIYEKFHDEVRESFILEMGAATPEQAVVQFSKIIDTKEGKEILSTLQEQQKLVERQEAKELFDSLDTTKQDTVKRDLGGGDERKALDNLQKYMKTATGRRIIEGLAGVSVGDSGMRLHTEHLHTSSRGARVVV